MKTSVKFFIGFLLVCFSLSVISYTVTNTTSMPPTKYCKDSAQLHYSTSQLAAMWKYYNVPDSCTVWQTFNSFYNKKTDSISNLPTGIAAYTFPVTNSSGKFVNSQLRRTVTGDSLIMGTYGLSNATVIRGDAGGNAKGYFTIGSGSFAYNNGLWANALASANLVTKALYRNIRANTSVATVFNWGNGVTISDSTNNSVANFCDNSVGYGVIRFNPHKKDFTTKTQILLDTNTASYLAYTGHWYQIYGDISNTFHDTVDFSLASTGGNKKWSFPNFTGIVLVGNNTTPTKDTSHITTTVNLPTFGARDTILGNPRKNGGTWIEVTDKAGNIYEIPAFKKI